MKSSLRFLGQELVVEGVIPADNAFNEAVYDEFIKIFGTDQFIIIAENFYFFYFVIIKQLKPLPFNR